MITTQFALGTLLAIGVLTPCAVLTGLALYEQIRHDGPRVLTGLGLTATALVALTWAALAWPLNLDYHSYEPVNGVVASVDHDETTTLVRLEGDSRDLTCIDTRCSLLSPGDRASLDCIRVWRINGPDPFECLFVSRKAT